MRRLMGGLVVAGLLALGAPDPTTQVVITKGCDRCLLLWPQWWCDIWYC